MTQLLVVVAIIQSITPFRSLTRSNSMRKYSTSISYSVSTPVHSVNPLISATSEKKTETSSEGGKINTMKRCKFKPLLLQI